MKMKLGETGNKLVLEAFKKSGISAEIRKKDYIIPLPTVTDWNIPIIP
jgi:hypothetical protein